MSVVERFSLRHMRAHARLREMIPGWQRYRDYQQQPSSEHVAAANAASIANATQSRYRAASDSASIFHRTWWLDAVTGGEWQVVESENHAGITAWLPICTERHFGQTLITMPPMTRTLGPIFAETKKAASPASRMRACHLVLASLIERLPPHLVFDQTFDPAVSDLMPFALRGHHIGVQYTLRLESCADLDAIWRGMRDKTRNVIRRAAERFDVRSDLPPADFVPFYFANADRRPWTAQFSQLQLEKLISACVCHEAGTVLFGVDRRDGSAAAAVFVVWDGAYMYYLVSSRDERIADSGAVSLLIWQAMQIANKKGLGFDFDTYADANGAKFVTQFGGRPVPRWRVIFAPPAVRLAYYVKRRIRDHVVH